jgi:ATP-binding cassette subfamily B protein
MDCGPTCLRMLAKYYGRSYTAQTLREMAQTSKDGVSILGLSEAAEAIGFRSIGVKITIEKLLSQAPLPCLLHWEQSHFVILYHVRSAQTGTIPGIFSRIIRTLMPSHSQSMAECEANVFYVSDPAKGLVTYSIAEFERYWLATGSERKNEGMALLLEPTSQFYEVKGEDSPVSGYSQLAGYIWQYRKLIFQLGLGMLVGSGLSLLLPFLTQSIVDVGISTRNMSFINIVLIGQMVLLCSTSAVDFIRGWIVLHISTRLNLSILSEFLLKLMRLPVSFFDVKQFGDIMQRIGDHHRIESFLTGQTLSVMFSLFNLLIFGFVLAYYHLSIFVVALGAATIYSFWVTLFLKQRRKLDARRFDMSSKNQSQIIQLIQGMQEIKLAGAETMGVGAHPGQAFQVECEEPIAFSVSASGRLIDKSRQKYIYQLPSRKIGVKRGTYARWHDVGSIYTGPIQCAYRANGQFFTITAGCQDQLRKTQ